MPVDSRRGLDLERIAMHADRPNDGLIHLRLENSDQPRIAAARADDVEPCPLAFPGQPRAFHQEELTVEHQMRREPRALVHVGEDNRARLVRHKALHPRHELVGQLVVNPTALGLHDSAAREMPRELEQSFVLA